MPGGRGLLLAQPGIVEKLFLKQRTRTSELVGEAGSGCHVSVSIKHRVLLKIDALTVFWKFYLVGVSKGRAKAEGTFI